jgi:hypothetical protein
MSPKSSTRWRGLHFVTSLSLCWLAAIAHGQFAVASEHQVYAFLGASPGEKVEPISPQQAAPAHETYKITRMADGTTETGVPQHTDYVLSSTNKKLTITFVQFDSQATAAEFMDRIITKYAKRVLDRKPILNEKRVRTGERVVVVFGEVGEKHAESTAVIRIDGPRLIEIESDTLEEVLALEKYRERVRAPVPND